MTIPYGQCRVYFCCHPEEHGTYLEPISNEIFMHQDCAVWYLSDPKAVRDNEFWDSVSQMQLFVMPVTKLLLTTTNPAIDEEFAFARSHHIPVLPLMQEENLAELFNRKCGELQFLDKYSQDKEALTYDDKLKAYLAAALIGEKMTEKIRQAFDAYIFLSYRKADRKQAQELMRLIHGNDFCRDIAIWYDEFLTPGENFNESIRKAIQMSDFFVMAVTPKMTQKPNYVQTHEFPYACEQHKIIIPVEMQPTDSKLLVERFAGIPPCINGLQEEELTSTLRQAARSIALQEPCNNPQHLFFIGLAYLNGIDVEVDHNRALRLITTAAEDGLTAAAEKLVDMYGRGHGVPWNMSQLLFWQRKTIEYQRRDYHIDPQPENAIRLIENLQGMADVERINNNRHQQLRLINEAYNVANWLCSQATDGISEKYLASCLTQLADFYQQTDAQKALQYYKESEKILRRILQHGGISIIEDIQLPVDAQVHIEHHLFTPLLQAIELMENGSATKKNTKAKETTDNKEQIIFCEQEPTSEVMLLLLDLCVVLCNQADALINIGQMTDQITLVEEAEDLYETICAYLLSDVMRANCPGRLQHLSVIFSRLGEKEKRRGEKGKAYQYYLKALAIDEDRLSRASQNRDPYALEAYAFGCMALVMVDPDNPDEYYLRMAIDAFQKIADAMPHIPEYRQRLEELKPFLSDVMEYRKIKNAERSQETSVFGKQYPISPNINRYKHRNDELIRKDFITKEREAQQEAVRRLEERRQSRAAERRQNDNMHCSIAELKQEKKEKKAENNTNQQSSIDTREPVPTAQFASTQSQTQSSYTHAYFRDARAIFEDSGRLDKREALELLEKSAAQTDEAWYYVGICYEKGIGCQKNANKAFQAYIRCQCVLSYYRIALCWQRGIGVKQSRYDAAQWFYASAVRGHKKSLREIAVDKSGSVHTGKKRVFKKCRVLEDYGFRMLG